VDTILTIIEKISITGLSGPPWQGDHKCGSTLLIVVQVIHHGNSLFSSPFQPDFNILLYYMLFFSSKNKGHKLDLTYWYYLTAINIFLIHQSLCVFFYLSIDIFSLVDSSVQGQFYCQCTIKSKNSKTFFYKCFSRKEWNQVL